jgi:hypothetical protein
MKAISVILSLIFLFACTKPEEKREVFTASQQQYSFAGTAEVSQQLQINASFAWSLSASVSWIKVSADKGTGDQEVIITTSEDNTSGIQRMGMITVTPSNQSFQPINITILQESLQPTLKVNTTKIHMEGMMNASDSLQIQSNLSWKITTNVTWLSFKDSAGKGNQTFHFHTSQENVTRENRSALITLTAINNPAIQPITLEVTQEYWNKAFKATNSEDILAMIPSENNVVFAGSAFAGQANGWIAKADQNGHLLWQKLYGGTQTEVLRSVAATPDGGYILAGSAESSNGDITGLRGSTDAWVLKLDANGNIIWSKAYGGTRYDDAKTIVATGDGYIVSGIGQSFDGDLQNTSGTGAIWVFKVDLSGNMVWSKFMGGGSGESRKLIPVENGNYLLLGTTHTITQTLTHQNVIVIKLDASGNKIWEKNYGGSETEKPYDVKMAANGNYVIAGVTYSSDGDVTEAFGASDAWIINIDINGNKIWQKSLGGSGIDEMQAVASTTDGGFLVAGWTASKDGDATGGDGWSEMWVVKLDQAGRKVWHKTFGGTGGERAQTIIAGSNDTYLIAGYSDSKECIDEKFHGDQDGWMIKITDK